MILARRARFVATALASAGVGVAPALGLARTETEATPPVAGEPPAPEEKGPRICLSDIDISGIEAERCGEGDDPECEPEVCLSVPQVCLSDMPPQVCLSVMPDSANREYRHDGFYLRAGALAGPLWFTLDDGAARRSPVGVAFGGNLAVGMTLAPGIVAGLALTLLHAPNPSEAGFRALDVWQLGPWLDVYAAPTSEWHAVLSLAPTALVAKSSEGTTGGPGFGGALWLGYDAWIGSEGSLGLMGGGLLGFASGERGGASVALRARALALSASLLWH